jgi:hypothetical protein
MASVSRAISDPAAGAKTGAGRQRGLPFRCSWTFRAERRRALPIGPPLKAMAPSTSWAAHGLQREVIQSFRQVRNKAMFRFSFFCVAVFLSAWLVGCGASRPAGAKVTGAVTVNGKPLPGGSVFMESEDGKLSDTGPIDDNGNYVVANAPLGKVRIALLLPEPPPPAPPALKGDAGKGPKLPDDVKGAISKELAAILPKVPAKYKKAADSGLTFEVKNVATQTYDIPIKGGK